MSKGEFEIIKGVPHDHKAKPPEELTSHSHRLEVFSNRFKHPMGLKKDAVILALAGKNHILGFEDALFPLLTKCLPIK